MHCKKFAVSALALGTAAVLAGCSLSPTSGNAAAGGAGNKPVIAYNTPDSWANYKQIREDFHKETGLTVPQDVKNSGQSIAAIENAKSNQQADTGYWGITFGVQAAKKGLLEPYKSGLSTDVDTTLTDPKNEWTTVHYGVVAILVNTQALGSTPVPTSWADLLRPEYNGKVFYPDPTSAAIGFFGASAANMASGGTENNWSPGMDYFKKLDANGAKHPVNTTPAKLAAGEYPILIDADFNGYLQKYQNHASVDVVIPKDGTIRVPYSIGLVKNGPNPDGGKKWIDFLLSDEGQEEFAKSYVHPVRGDIPADVKSQMKPDADYAAVKPVDYTKLAEGQDDFNGKFKAVIGNS